MKFDDLLGANLSGSIGGITASKNKASNYFRVKHRPVQPNSVAQLNAKSRFGSGAGIFRALSAVNKALWNGFAQGIFSPRNTTNNGQYSGQQSCQALTTSFNNATAENRAFGVEVNGSVLAGGEAFENFIGPLEVPPILSTNSALKLRPSGFVATSLIDVEIKNDGQFSFKMQVGDGTGADIDSFVNSSGAKVGYATFMSSGNPTANMFFKEKLRYLLGYFNHVEATVPADLDAAVDFEFSSTDAFPIGNYKTFPGTGETVLISVFAVDINNQMSLVGSRETTIIAA